MKRNRIAGWLSLSVLFAAAGCDSHRSDPPPPEALPAPVAPPPAAPAAAVSVAPPEPAPPPKPPVTKGPPDGLIADRWVAGGRCNIESINGPENAGKPAIVKSGTMMKVTGWALDQKAALLADAIYVRFLSRKAGDYYGTATGGLRRDDVPSYLHMDPKFALSGFELNFDSSLLEPGDYTVTTVFRVGEKTYICDNGRRITVQP